MKIKLPKPTSTEFRYPERLFQVIDQDGIFRYIRWPIPNHCEYTDTCVCIDSNLGIFARVRAVDTIFLERDFTQTDLVFRRCSFDSLE